ncbi:MAG: prepilin-type N-terminal cleavage/methylation domain-containing protein [Candidatus Omnitrophota bacterium]
MISRIGSKRCKQFIAGFTLLEVIVTTAILSMGAVLIHEAYFLFFDLYNYSIHYLSVLPWMDEKAWQAEDYLNQAGTLEGVGETGGFEKKGKYFQWELSSSAIDANQGLYKINLSVFWQEAQRGISVTRTTYIAYENREKA